MGKDCSQDFGLVLRDEVDGCTVVSVVAVVSDGCGLKQLAFLCCTLRVQIHTNVFSGAVFPGEQDPSVSVEWLVPLSSLQS